MRLPGRFLKKDNPAYFDKNKIESIKNHYN